MEGERDTTRMWEVDFFDGPEGGFDLWMAHIYREKVKERWQEL